MESAFKMQCHTLVGNNFKMLFSFLHRVTYVFGGTVKYPVQEITPTTLTVNALKTLRQVDYLANQVLSETGRPFYIRVPYINEIGT